jgi:two-component system NtrC family response regulator
LSRRGKFRTDLFYRLHVFPLSVPPLRERKDDIPDLVKHFLHRFNRRMHKQVTGIEPAALDRLLAYDWPGNVRELENRVKRGVIMAEGAQVTADDLELGQETGFTAIRTLKEARETLERELVQQALRRHGGKISPAAIDLGVSRPTLYELMDKLAIKRGED